MTAGPSGTSHSPTSPSVQELVEEGDEGDNELERESQHTIDTTSDEPQSTGETTDDN